VQLGEAGHGQVRFALVLQVREAQAQQLHADDVGKHPGQFDLHELDAARGLPNWWRCDTYPTAAS
jgi:hypothetical protein